MSSASALAVPPPGFARALGELLASAPAVLDGAWQILIDTLAVAALAVVIAAAVARRWAVARDAVLAAALAVVLWLVLGRWVTDAWPDVWDSLPAAIPPPGYPSARVAVPAAVLVTVSPHLVRPARRLGHWLVALAAVAVVSLGAATAVGAVAGVLVATAAACAVHLALGSSGGRPGLGDVATGLGQLGVAVRSIGAADRQQAGLFLVTATDDEDRPLDGQGVRPGCPRRRPGHHPVAHGCGTGSRDHRCGWGGCSRSSTRPS